MAITLKFLINTRRENAKTKRSPIGLRILKNRKKAEGKISLVPVPRSALEFWDQETQRFTKKFEQHKAYNLMLNTLENEFHYFLREHHNELSTITPKEIRDHLLNRNSVEDTSNLAESIMSYYTNDILPDRDKAHGTKKNYKKSINHFCSFLKANRLEDLRVEDFRRKHANKFLNYLRQPNEETGKVGLKGQSVNSIIKNIKPFFVKLQYEERINSNPFIGVRAKPKKTFKPRLTNEDFRRIAELDLSQKPKLQPYRDIFFFLCYTGLSHCDAINLRITDVKNGYIQLYRKKSNVSVKQFLTKQSKAIVKKYSGQIPEDRILPKRSLDKTNLNIKLIAALAGIDYNVTTYSARRFFRQSIHEAGIRESLVVKTLMGHTRSHDMDNHYLFVNDTILNEAKKKLQKHIKLILK
ncbi:MAG: site-specific integrase [Winogradskyella sp.]